MGKRLSKIVTRTGDQGTTVLADGSRRAKNDPLIQCLGDIDELNSWIGLVLSQVEDQSARELLLRVQHDLFDLGAELSLPGEHKLSALYVEYLEQQIDQLNQSLQPLEEFILPGGSGLLGNLHLARCVCRRSERSLVDLHLQQQQNPVSLQYINRLSDLLFVLARFLGNSNGLKETYWQSQYSRIKPR